MEPPKTDFDALVAEAKALESDDPMARLWAAVYALPQWLFIARGEPPNLRPYIGVVDEKPFLMAFTDPAHAKDFAKGNGLAAPDGSVGVLAMPVPGFIETLPEYERHGVFAVMFNPGEHGFFAPLANVKALFGLHGKGERPA